MASAQQHSSAHPEDPIAQATSPTLRIIRPRKDEIVQLPAYAHFQSSGPGFSAVYIDGLLIYEAMHSAASNYTVSVPLRGLSHEEHVISVEIVDSHGDFVADGSSCSFLVVSSNSSASLEVPAVSSYYEGVEPCERYSPSLSEDERANAVVKDGWLLLHQNLEFTRIEPGDSCRDLSWSERKHPRRVFDAFQFFNELDILEIRLHELDPVVFKFILVEATRTHSNEAKPLVYDMNRERFSAFKDKIIHIIVEDLPQDGDPWVLENFQRNAIMRGLTEAHPNDLVVIADVDEIPSSFILDAVRSCDGPTSPTWLYSRFFNFKFNWEFQGLWKHPQVVRMAQLMPGLDEAVTPQQVRMGAMRPYHTKIENAGWHCSFFSDAEGVMQKVQAFTHQELNRKVCCHFSYSLARQG